jgi:hypothetical protein
VRWRKAGPDHDRRDQGGNAGAKVAGTIPMSQARARVRARFEGDVRRIRIHSLAAVPTLEIQLDDGTGRISALFMGRRGIAGIECGRRLLIEGTPVVTERGLTLYNPAYDLR